MKSILFVIVLLMLVSTMNAFRLREMTNAEARLQAETDAQFLNYLSNGVGKYLENIFCFKKFILMIFLRLGQK